MEQKKWWQSSGFWTAFILLIASLWTGYSAEVGDTLTKAILAISAGGFAIFRLVKESEIDFGKWIKSGNTINYIVTIVAMIAGEQFVDLVPSVQDLVQAIMAKDFPAIFAALFSLGTIIFYLVTNKEDNPKEKVLQETTLQ